MQKEWVSAAAPAFPRAVQGLSRIHILNAVSKEVVVYTEQDRLKAIPEEVQDVYHSRREKILDLGNVGIKAVSYTHLDVYKRQPFLQ